MSTNNQPPRDLNFFQGLIDQVLLAWKLMKDDEVPFYLKLIPVLTALYVISPVDFIPDAILPVGLLDDPFAVLLGVKAFLRMAPDHVIARHTGKGEVVEAEYVSEPMDKELHETIRINPDQ